VTLEKQQRMIADLTRELALCGAQDAFHDPTVASVARMTKISPEDRSRIAKLGAQKRWAKRRLETAGQHE
jgi:hypothetical protein